MRRIILALTALFLVLSFTPSHGMEYESLRRGFERPDHATWGEVPLWWWEGAPMTRAHATWTLEELAAKGVKAVCPIQRSPGRCDPESFAPEWWDMLTHVHQECRRLGMELWVYDQVGYGNYGWLEKAASALSDADAAITSRVQFLSATGVAGKALSLDIPAGRLIAARAYPVEKNMADDVKSMALKEAVPGQRLEWTPPEGKWRVAISVAVPMQSFYLNTKAADTFVDLLYGKIERTLGSDAMGKSFAGVFQDEHPPTPRDIYTAELDRAFKQKTGYDLGRAIPALHFDVGPRTPKYRTDFFDVYLGLVEETYWKRVFDWAEARDILTSHDNWGRNNIHRQSQGYIDYFRSQRWFSAPGYDDAGQRPVTGRNYYDTKIASSIARLYGRPRVWNEAFHSSGWGRTTDQTLSWLSAGMAFGANLYDEHGLYYDTRASTWEHAAPDPHWRQPYWRYYKTLSDWVARTSFLMSQGIHVVDAAVHYPVVSLLAGTPPGEKAPDYNLYMRLSRTIYDAGIDNDIIDDDSILSGEIKDGRLFAGGNGYHTLVFGPEMTIRKAVLEKACDLAESGGTVLLFRNLPTASTEAGREDPELTRLLLKLVGTSKASKIAKHIITKRFKSGGLSAFIPADMARLPGLITNRDFMPAEKRAFVAHRMIGDTHVYLVQNPEEETLLLDARFRVDAIPEVWDGFSGAASPVHSFSREKGTGYTRVKHPLKGNLATFFVFRPGDATEGGEKALAVQPKPITLPEAWQLSVIPTRDNARGEYRWPPTDETIGLEVRSFRYHDASMLEISEKEVCSPDLDDSQWRECLYSTGPYWLFAASLPQDAALPDNLIKSGETIVEGASFNLDAKTFAWQPLSFSRTIGAARPAPWGGHSGYPDGHIDKNFVHLPKGRKLLFTRLRSPKAQRLGLRVELHNKTPRLWVNGVEQPFEDAVGNLPLKAGGNNVLLDLPDGDHGRLFVQAVPPSAASMQEASRGSVAPDLKQASWIWSGDTQSCFVRKTFKLKEMPRQARVIISAFSGYRLFINGKKIAEEIGPWSNWKRPERFSILPHLKTGENVIAIWGQLFAGQNVNKGEGAFKSRGIVAALALRNQDGTEMQLVTDGTWRGSVEDAEGWETVAFDASAWRPAQVCGKMGDAPWGMTAVQNIGSVTEPARPLSIHLDSPYLTCFEEARDIVYDVKPKDAPRVGWFRFKAPPGLRSLTVPGNWETQVWVDGKPAEMQGLGSAPETRKNITALIKSPSRHVSQVAIRMEMAPGAYAGAAFEKPIALKLAGSGIIKPGLWRDHAMPTYSGICVYKQKVMLDKADLDGRTFLDLGQVLVAAEVFINGKSAGVRLARPFEFDVSGLIRAGENSVEIHVANTIAPHYTTIPAMNLGPTDSGLLGPVTLTRRLSGKAWKAWRKKEAARLDKKLKTMTPQLDEARKQWEKKAGWKTVPPKETGKTAREHFFATNAETITGIKLALSEGALESIAASMADPGKQQPVRGRYVRIEINDRPEFLALAEVEVLSGKENIARKGTAKQSSTSHGGSAHLAIDGNTDGAFNGGSVTHTNPNPSPWWELDLGGVRQIDRIRIWNRMDTDLYLRLKDCVVSVLDAERQVIWKKKVETPPKPDLTLYLGGRVALDLKRLSEENGTRIFSASMPAGAEGLAFSGAKITLQLKTPVTADKMSLSVTQGGPPICDIPMHIEEILLIPEDQRTNAQRKTMNRFYLSVAPQLDADRERLKNLPLLPLFSLNGEHGF